jgi:hypothetical protein
MRNRLDASSHRTQAPHQHQPLTNVTQITRQIAYQRESRLACGLLVHGPSGCGLVGVMSLRLDGSG